MNITGKIITKTVKEEECKECKKKEPKYIITNERTKQTETTNDTLYWTIHQLNSQFEYGEITIQQYTEMATPLYDEYRTKLKNKQTK